VDEQAYLDRKRFPLSNKRQLDLQGQMLQDSINLDELEQALEYGRKLRPDQEQVLAELREFDGDGKPVNAPAPVMSEGTVRKLASLEYQFVRLDADLDDLRDVLRQVAREAPSCAVAARKVQAARRVLRHALDGLDALVTAAVAALERMPEAPF
jgi:hypothetical protein